MRRGGEGGGEGWVGVGRAQRRRGGTKNENRPRAPPPFYSLSLTLLAVGACIRAPVLALGQAGHGVALRRRGRGRGLERTPGVRPSVPPPPFSTHSHAWLDVGRPRHRRAQQQQQRHQSAGSAHCGKRGAPGFLSAGRARSPSVPLLLGWLLCCLLGELSGQGRQRKQGTQRKVKNKNVTQPCFDLFSSCSRRPRPPPPGRPATPAATGHPCG